MRTSTHRIRRQRWLCRTGTPEQAFALRQALREAQETAIPAVFERAFDAVAGGGEVIRLPRLELRVRLADGDDLAAVLPELLDRALREQLAGLRKPAVHSQGAERAAASATRRSVRDSRRDGLIRYLRTGSLPWELAREDAAALLEEWRETVAADLAEILSQAPDARAPLSQRITFFFRLLQLLPEERWAEIAGHLSRWLPAAQAAALRRVLATLSSRTAPSSFLSSEVRRRLAAAALGLAMQAPERMSMGGSELEKALAKALGIAPGGLRVYMESLPTEIAAFFAPWMDVVARTARASGEKVSAPVPNPSSPVSTLSSTGQDEEAGPLAVRSAGLVLLHPYLPRLFEHLGLLRAGEPGFSWTALPRAAALLHWLATGREEVLEFELGFIKVLLGRRPEEPLLLDGRLLTDSDREEGEALLQAVISHWRALKTTTPAGLRASFLQRGGLLRDEEKSWRLQVETAAFDLLLDHLPWGLGVVKLPWMQQPIFTEWPTP